MINFILVAAMFGGILLLFGAFRIWRRSGASRQVLLMGVAGLVILGNVAIWSVPDKNGNSLAEAKP